VVEINILFGLLYLAGVVRSLDLWANDDTDVKMCCAVISFIRVNDKLTPIRYIFDDFERRCQQNYIVGAYI